MSILDNYKNNKHFISFSESFMNDDEEVLDVIDGFIGTLMETKGDDKHHNGLLFCTNQKVCFHRKGFFSNVSRTIPVKNISSIDFHDNYCISKAKSVFSYVFAYKLNC